MTHQLARVRASRVPAIRGVGIRRMLLFDRTRPTYDYATGATVQGRRLPTEVRYPSAALTSGERRAAPVRFRRGGYPLVIFAEGYGANPGLYAKLLDAWVRAGFVVASPEFPETTYPLPERLAAAADPHGDPELDMLNEPGDLAFVISTLEQKAHARSGFLRGLITPSEVLLAGQSDGGAVVGAYGYDARYDRLVPPVRGVAVFEGYEFGGDDAAYRHPSATPLLVVQSTTDTCNEPELSVELYDAVQGPKFFLRLSGATHLGPYDGAEPLAFRAVERTSLRFFAHALSPTAVPPSAVLSAGHLGTVSSAQDSASVGSMPTPPGSPYCAPAY